MNIKGVLKLLFFIFEAKWRKQGFAKQVLFFEAKQENKLVYFRQLFTNSLNNGWELNGLDLNSG